MPMTTLRSAFRRVEIAFEQFALGPDCPPLQAQPVCNHPVWEASQEIYRIPAVWRRSERRAVAVKHDRN